MMQRRAEAGLLDAVGAYFQYATPDLGPDIESFQCTEWGEYKKICAVAGMRYFGSVLASQPWLVREAHTVTDIAASADFAKIDIPADGANLTAWRERVCACCF